MRQLSAVIGPSGSFATASQPPLLGAPCMGMTPRAPQRLPSCPCPSSSHSQHPPARAQASLTTSVGKGLAMSSNSFHVIGRKMTRNDFISAFLTSSEVEYCGLRLFRQKLLEVFNRIVKHDGRLAVMHAAGKAPFFYSFGTQVTLRRWQGNIVVFPAAVRVLPWPVLQHPDSILVLLQAKDFFTCNLT
jgi:hypothetical protein